MVRRSCIRPARAATFSRLAAVGLSILAAAADAAEGAGPEPLEEVVVSAFKREYLEPRSDVGLGILAETLETPLSITVIPQDVLEDQQVNNVEDALRNVASVTKFKQGNGGEEKFSIRGFDSSQSLYKDGVRLNNRFNATNIATTETANIERYEILKGPASILYGQGEPGGIINYVTKKPLFERYSSMEAMGGTEDFKRVEFDTTGPVFERFAYRLVGSYENSDSYRDEVGRERLLLGPSLTWEPSTDTTVTGGFEYIADDYTQDRGQSLSAAGNGRFRYSADISPETFLGIPDWNDRTNSDYIRGAVALAHAFNDVYSLDIRGSYISVDKELFDSSPRLQAMDGRFPISPLFQEGDGETTSLRIGNVLTLDDTFGFNHRILLEGTYESIQNDGFSYGVTASQPIFYDPATGGYTDATLMINTSNPFAIVTDEQEYGVVIQDLVSYDERHYLLAGLSYREFSDDENEFDADDLSPRVGYLFRPVPWASLYVSYALGFVPTSLTDQNDEVLEPETSEQVEVGFKTELFEGSLSFTGALFDVRKKDVAYTDPASLNLPPAEQYSASIGEIRTRGFETQIIGRIGMSWRVIAGYSYLDNEILGGDPLLGTTGNRLPGVPKHSGSLWSVYEFARGPLAGLGLGGGIFAQDDVYLGLENRSKYSGWAQLDLLAYYKREHWKLQLNVKNVLDKEYYLTQALAAEGLASVRVGTSAPLGVVGSVAYEY